MIFHPFQQGGTAVLNGLLVPFPHVIKTVLRKIAVHHKQVAFFLVIKVARQYLVMQAYADKIFPREKFENLMDEFFSVRHQD